MLGEAGTLDLAPPFFSAFRDSTLFFLTLHRLSSSASFTQYYARFFSLLPGVVIQRHLLVKKVVLLLAAGWTPPEEPPGPGFWAWARAPQRMTSEYSHHLRVPICKDSFSTRRGPVFPRHVPSFRLALCSTRPSWWPSNSRIRLATRREKREKVMFLPIECHVSYAPCSRPIQPALSSSTVRGADSRPVNDCSPCHPVDNCSKGYIE